VGGPCCSAAAEGFNAAAAEEASGAFKGKLAQPYFGWAAEAEAAEEEMMVGRTERNCRPQLLAFPLRGSVLLSWRSVLTATATFFRPMEEVKMYAMSGWPLVLVVLLGVGSCVGCGGGYW
jgi:hypothetical protein